jgi:hypothetical protein
MNSQTERYQAAPRLKIFGFGCVAWLVVAFGGFMVLSMMLGAGHADVFVTLLFGWAAFCVRTGARIQWNFELIATSLVCTVVSLTLAHWLLRGFARSVSRSRGKAWAWHWKWTWCGAGVVGVAFFVGMAVVGIVHQVAWIRSSPEPLLERKGRGWEIRYDMRNVSLAYQLASETATNDLKALRKELWNPGSGYLGSPEKTSYVMQAYHHLVILDEKKGIRGFLTFPRNPSWAAEQGGYLTLNEDAEPISWEKVLECLRKFRDRMEPL